MDVDANEKWGENSHNLVINTNLTMQTERNICAPFPTRLETTERQ